MWKKRKITMTSEIIITGFGGQGVMLMGQILVTAGMMEGKEVSWYPSYGMEMRGGSANCAVIVSDGKIGSPLVSVPDVLAAMSFPALSKFVDAVKPGGIVLFNSSLIERNPRTEDVTSHAVPANDIANRLKNPRIMNMVMLGALVAATGVVSREALSGAFRKMFEKKFAHKPELFGMNDNAMAEGMRSIAA
jgi:2-oxoglutarate ferredoxin oxidoreductase subunit gamma